MRIGKHECVFIEDLEKRQKWWVFSARNGWRAKEAKRKKKAGIKMFPDTFFWDENSGQEWRNDLLPVLSFSFLRFLRLYVPTHNFIFVQLTQHQPLSPGVISFPFFLFLLSCVLFSSLLFWSLTLPFPLFQFSIHLPPLHFLLRSLPRFASYGLLNFSFLFNSPNFPFPFVSRVRSRDLPSSMKKFFISMSSLHSSPLLLAKLQRRTLDSSPLDDHFFCS